MAEYTDDLALIVRYDGTKEAFEAVKSSYLGKVVFIYGSKTEVTNQAGLVQAIWVSDANGGRYLDMANVDTIKEGMTHIAGLAIGGTVKTLANGANGINFKGANGISITFNPSNSTDQNGVPYWNVEVNGQGVVDTIKGASNDGVSVLTLYGVKNYAQAAANTAKNEVVGEDTDTKSSDTIKGAKKYADKVKTDLEGTDSDTKDSTTIAGAKKYADDAVAKIVSDGSDASTDDTIKGAKKYTDEAEAALLGKPNDTLDDNTILGIKNYTKQLATNSEVSIIESEGTGDIGKVYTFYQGGTTEAHKIGVINTPKELVVKSGQVVVNPTGQPAGTYIELTIQNQDAPLYINVADLVDVYTAQAGAMEVQLAISANNEISAAIVAVNGSKITDGTVAMRKLESSVQTSLGKADSAYQKPTTGIPKSDLAEGVKSSLDKADSAIVALSGDGYIKVENVGASTTEKKIKANTAEITSETATTDGLATVADIRAYLAARFSVKVVS